MLCTASHLRVLPPLALRWGLLFKNLPLSQGLAFLQGLFYHNLLARFPHPYCKGFPFCFPPSKGFSSWLALFSFLPLLVLFFYNKFSHPSTKPYCNVFFHLEKGFFSFEKRVCVALLPRTLVRFILDGKKNLGKKTKKLIKSDQTIKNLIKPCFWSDLTCFDQIWSDF